jgi:D-3-phosphoglycerate dehydrogenase
MPKILITTSTFAEFDGAPLKKLKDHGYEYVLNPHRRKVTAQEFLHLAHGAVGAVAGTEDLNADVLTQAKGLKVISRCGVGVDNINLDTAKKLKIKIFNTPDVVTAPVAELTMGLMLSLLRKTFLMDRQIRKGQWNKTMGNLLKGKTVGIIGLGRIGSAVADLLKPFKVKLIYSDIVKKKAKTIKYVKLDDLLETSDIITLHLSGGTGVVLSGSSLGKCKKGSYILNCARGGLIDEAALYENLTSGHLAGAALDVFEKEPYQGPLSKLDNVILTPHIGSYAREARVEMEMQAVENLIKGLKKI